MLSSEELSQRIVGVQGGCAPPLHFDVYVSGHSANPPAMQARPPAKRGGLGHERAGIVTRESAPLKAMLLTNEPFNALVEQYFSNRNRTWHFWNGY